MAAAMLEAVLLQPVRAQRGAAAVGERTRVESSGGPQALIIIALARPRCFGNVAHNNNVMTNC